MTDRRLPETVAVPAEVLLRCPYPGCQGAIAEGSFKDEFVTCPTCHRVATRCDRVDGEGRCPTLNRPLARFCRRCKTEFSADWASNKWLEDTRAGSDRSVFASVDAELRLKLGPPETVAKLSQVLPSNQAQIWPIELVAAGGLLWLGAADTRFLLIEPFADKGESRLVRDQLWPDMNTRLRACASGSWIVMSCERGVRALNLLAIDDATRSGKDRYVRVWDAGPDRLLASPVLLNGPSDADPISAQNRTVCWLTGPGVNGSVLHWATLSLRDGGNLQPRSLKLNLGSGGDEDRPLLMCLPMGPRDQLLLAQRNGLWLIDLLDDKSADGPKPRPLVEGRRLITHLENMPGVVVPGRNDAGAGGRLFVCEEEGESERRGLLEARLTPEGGVSVMTNWDLSCFPLGYGEAGGQRGLLYVTRQDLGLLDRMDNRMKLDTNSNLEGIGHGLAAGSLVFCSGSTTEGGRTHWFLIVFDLESQHPIETLVWPAAIAPPVVLGRFVFTIEQPLTNPGSDLLLTRRELFDPARKKLPEKTP